MSWALVLKHCAGLRATAIQTRVSLELLESQIGSLETFAKACQEREQAPRAQVAYPPTCNGKLAEDCARHTPEAAHDVGGMGGDQMMCRGCGLDPRVTSQTVTE